MLSRKLCLTVCLAALLASPAANANFIFSTDTMLFKQETDVWCGPATAQMILYQGQVFKEQTDLWNKIDASREEPNTSFYTDPGGLRTTLNAFDTVEQDTWKVFSGTDQDLIIEVLMESMVRADRPSAILINDGNHWVAWVGFESDIDPLLGDATLLSVTLNDPDNFNPHVANLTGAEFSDIFSPNSFGNVYDKQYVAVSVPEPAMLVLVGLGLCVTLLVTVRRRVVVRN